MAKNDNKQPYDWRHQGDRRKVVDRRKADERRGPLRWDPTKKDRRNRSERRKKRPADKQ